MTRADLGKIVLINGGEYDPDTVYTEKTFVYWMGSTYVALKTNVGIEPVNDLVNWQYMARGLAVEDFNPSGYVYVGDTEDTEEGTVPDPILDADKLGGNPPEYYAPQHEISDVFSEDKDYATGDYCIYLNGLYRFTSPKPAGPWDWNAVVPITISQELQSVRDEINKGAEREEIILYKYNDTRVVRLTAVGKTALLDFLFVPLTSSTMTIPAGYRPAQQAASVGVNRTNQVPVVIQIDPDGTIFVLELNGNGVKDVVIQGQISWLIP